MVIDMPNFNLMTFFVVYNKCTFFAKTSFVVGRRKTASDFMDLRKKKNPANSTGFVQKNQMLPIKSARMSNFVVSNKVRVF